MSEQVDKVSVSGGQSSDSERDDLSVELDMADFPQACEQCGRPFRTGDLIGFGDAGIVCAEHLDGSAGDR